MQLRPVTEQDQAFLRAVYAGTRSRELALTGWDDASCQTFLNLQFEAQNLHYRSQYPAARYEIIEVQGLAVGRLWVQRSAQEIRVLDISLLPDWRGLGLGTACLQALLDEAALAQLPVRLHVELMNPARHLYERLGFQPVVQQGVHLKMEWRAATRPADTHRTESCNEQA